MSRRTTINFRTRITWSCMVICLLTISCVFAVPPDTNSNDITLDEAQKLLPFGVCLPTYLPASVEMNDTVQYHNEFGDPNESDVTIDYFGQKNQAVVLTIYERHGPGHSLDAYDSSTRRINLRQLIAWQAGWSKVDELQSQVEVEYEVYSLDSDRLLIEIQSPESLQAIQITWYLQQFVFIDIYSRLSKEETKRIADSVTNCATPPTSTP